MLGETGLVDGCQVLDGIKLEEKHFFKDTDLLRLFMIKKDN